MRTTGKKTKRIRNSVGRAVFAAVSVLMQVGWIVLLLQSVSSYYPYISIATQILALCLVVAIYSQHRSSASKLTWTVLILLFPVLGLSLYFLVGQPWATHSIRKRFENVDSNLYGLLPQDANVMNELRAEDSAVANQAAYLQRWGTYPIYRNTQVEFHAQTSDAFRELKAELRRAKKFIFMEYHAIELSQCFMELEEILAERARSGVEVRLFYDDVGSLTFIAPNFIQRMQEKGISCRVFNPMIPLASAFMNNRDHRKLTVIDGRVGFTGGYNLADEYFNVKHPYGHWKDTGVKLTGDAVRSLTVMFLEMWNAERKADTDYARYTDVPLAGIEASGYVQPYADSPLDDERVGENVYMNLIKNARRYVYITTPYLILDDEMTQELTLASKRGVDVRIITPGIPDKKLIYQITRSYYAVLARSGVRIFEYTPGFVHAKQMLSDDETAVVGTINLDFRSLYLHFEDGVFLYRCDALHGIRRDFEKTFPLCREMTDQYRIKRFAPMRVAQNLLRLFAPLL